MAVLLTAFLGFTNACGKSEGEKNTELAQLPEVDMTLQKQAEDFLNKYLGELDKLYVDQATKYWAAANSGKAEDFDAYAESDLNLRKVHSDPKRYAEIQKLLAQKDKLKPLTARSLTVAELGFKGNQLPQELLEKMTKTAAEIEQYFTAFRGKLKGKEYADNELKDMLKTEMNSAKRQKIWEAMKQVGEAVGPKLIELAKIRNEAAKKLGYLNYWDMQIRLQEHNPEQIISIFAELETQTNEPFKQRKAKIDSELAARFKIKPAEMRPWHYDDPFFQETPPSDKIDMDDFYKDKKKEDIIEIAKKFYADIDLPIESIVEKSDIYERPGKNQHAFCTSIDHKGDTRALLNIKPSARWMETALHEMGHGVYDKFMDYTLPFNLRDAAHTFTTEAVAMIFGALARNPVWMTAYANCDNAKIKALEPEILEQRKREQLIFARWALVMLNFEKSLYENPDQDLNKLWWDLVERFQGVTRPGNRNSPDWAAKIHFTIAPVYYHNYQLGELFAAQLRGTLSKLAKHTGPSYTLNYGQHKEFGNYFKEKIFKPGMTMTWPDFIQAATGEPLSAKYFADEVK